MKKISILLLTIFALASCGQKGINTATTIAPEYNEQKTEKVQIVTSITPLTSITKYIGGEYVNVISLVPGGVSPHGFDLKPHQLIDIEKSDLIVSLGLEHIDGFLDKAIHKKENVLIVSRGIKMLEASEHDDHSDHKDEDHHEDEHHDDHHEDKHEDEHHEEHDDEHENHESDPHIWGSGENAYVIATSIVQALSKIQPENAASFEENLESFKKEINAAKHSFEENIKGKKQGDFIIFHDAYNYLFAEFNVDSNKKHVFRKNILSDPNSNDMKSLIDEIKEKTIQIAFKEPQLNSSSLKNLSSEYSLEVYILDPLGSDDSSTGYIKNYKNNLKSLEKIYE